MKAISDHFNHKFKNRRQDKETCSKLYDILLATETIIKQKRNVILCNRQFY